MNIDLVLLFIFAIFLLIFMFLNKKKVKIEKIAFPFIYMLLYRTKLGLKAMDKLSKKHPKLLSFLSFAGIIIGFFGMIFILTLLTWGVYGYLFLDKPPPVAPLLPGIKAPGLPRLSFFHWIIAIFILAGVHEFSHGLVSRLYNIKLKSSGFAIFSFLLPIIPAAFVEPDEDELKKRNNKQQLGVLAAGSFSNFITGAIFLLLSLFILSPIVGAMIDSSGVEIRKVEQDYPANLSGVSENELILSINNIQVNNVEEFIGIMEKIKPGQNINLVTNKSTYILKATKNPLGKDNAYLGISVSPAKQEYKKEYGFLPYIFSWLALLVFWVFIANFGVGLFNLLPLGPVDGGRMFYLVALHFLKNEEKAKKLWTFVSLFCLLLIVISLSPFIIKLLSFIFNPFLSLLL